MMRTVEGIYKDGKVTLKEKLPDVAEGRVLITFLQTNYHLSPNTKGHVMQFGTFPELQTITDEDFKAAEFHIDSDDGLVMS